MLNLTKITKITIGLIIILIGVSSAIYYYSGNMSKITRYFKKSNTNNNTTKEHNAKYIKIADSNFYTSAQNNNSRYSDLDEEINIKVYKKVSPGVVNIITKVFSYNFIFEPIIREGAGSGSVINKKGHILTNYHVIRSASRLEVTLSNNKKYPAKVVGVDIEDDLAIIKIKAPPNELHPIKIADSNKLRVGQKVLAIGNPFGLERTLTTGIISSLGRTIKGASGELIEGVIQTDAAINPGNSGGPLLNSDGNLIGVNTSIFSPSGGGNIGIGFAVPSNTVRFVINDLVNYGRVRRSTMGISGFPLSKIQGLAKYLKLPVKNGIVVVEATKNLPANKAGIRGYNKILRVGNLEIPVGGDIIIKINNRNIKNGKDVSLAFRKKRPGNIVTVTIVRNNKIKKIKVRLVSQ